MILRKYFLQSRSIAFISKGEITMQHWNKYLIPIKIHAPLIFAHLACAEIKGSFAQYECAKIKGRRENATNEWKNGKFTVK